MTRRSVIIIDEFKTLVENNYGTTLIQSNNYQKGYSIITQQSFNTFNINKGYLQRQFISSLQLLTKISSKVLQVHFSKCSLLVNQLI